MQRPVTAADHARAALVLGIPSDTPVAEARKAWQRLVRDLHPDRPGGDARRMAEVNAAWDLFCRPVAPEAPRAAPQRPSTAPRPTGTGVFVVEHPSYSALAISGNLRAFAEAFAEAANGAIAAHRLAWWLGLPVPLDLRVPMHLYHRVAYNLHTGTLTVHYSTRLVAGKNTFPMPRFTGVSVSPRGVVLHANDVPFLAYGSFEADTLESPRRLFFDMGAHKVEIVPGSLPPHVATMDSALASLALDTRAKALARRLAKGRGPRWMRPVQRALHSLLSQACRLWPAGRRPLE